MEEGFKPTCYAVRHRSAKEIRDAEDAKVLVVSIGLETFEQRTPKLVKEHLKSIDRNKRGILCNDKGGFRDRELKDRIEESL